MANDEKEPERLVQDPIHERMSVANARAHVASASAMFDVVVEHEDGASGLDIGGPLITDQCPDSFKRPTKESRKQETAAKADSVVDRRPHPPTTHRNGT